jgi:2-keto-3-deoxy-L-rhamnonate aldolase RhmA
MKSSLAPTTLFLGIALLGLSQVAPGQAPTKGAANPKLYNTVKQKLLDGKQVFSFTQSRPDPESYCESAKHYDYGWIDLQHSNLTFGDVAKMLAACPKAPATPIVRVPDAQEWMIQQATDLGALGIVVPTVDDANKAREAAKWLRYPPVAHRSTGASQSTQIWGSADVNYRLTANDNMLLIVMIETPVGVANAYEIASVPGVDVVIIGNNDLTQFSGYEATDPRYLALVTKVHDDTLRAGKIFGQANAIFATGHPLSGSSFFFQNGPSNDGWTPPARAGRGGAGRTPATPPAKK